jgi:murein DD-endopeptidase MepM/ murein hydrolase activator NlpD
MNMPPTHKVAIGLIISCLLQNCRTGAPNESQSLTASSTCDGVSSVVSPKRYTTEDHYLPWAKDTAFKISSYPGNFSHVGKMAYAWDFAMPVGTEVLATVDGHIRKVQYSAKAPTFGGQAAADYANYVILYWGDGSYRESIYLHLSEVGVKEGDFVKRGEVLGLSGCTGWCRGAHLHYQVQEGPECHKRSDISYYLNSLELNFKEDIPKKIEMATSKNAKSSGGGTPPPIISPTPGGSKSEPTPSKPPAPSDSNCRCARSSCKLNQLYQFTPAGVVFTNRVDLGSVGEGEILQVIKTDKPSGSAAPSVIKVTSTESGAIGWLLPNQITAACLN